MAVCSKCGKKIPKDATTCPSCHKPISKNVPPKDVKIKSVPLKVKRVKTVKENKSSIKENISNTANITFFLIAALILINLVLISNFYNQRLENKEEPVKEQPIIEVSKLGSWKDQNDELFIFANDDNFYWYDSYSVQDDNYYQGTYNYKVGLAALEEMGYTEEEFYITFGDDLSLDNVYSINLFPTKYIENNENLSSTKIGTNDTWWYLLIIKDDETAIAYNKTLDLRYNLSRYNR